MPRHWRILAVFSALLCNCTGPGALPPGNTPDAGPITTPPPDGAAPAEDDPPLPDRATVPANVPFRRLNVFEFNNTVRDLLGGSAPTFTRARLGYDQAASLSGFLRGASVASGDDVRGLMLTAEEIAGAALANLPALLPCAKDLPPAGEDACADQFITDFGLRAFRRPLEARERDRLRALYKQLRAPEIGGTFTQAIGDVLTAMLEAPEFIYRGELGPSGPTRDGTLIRFNGYELASRLSYLFWGSMPDQTLFTAAAQGKLSSTGELVKQARRLLADARAADAIGDFHRQLLEVDALDEIAKDPSFADYTPQLGRALMDESRLFATSVFLGAQADGKLETLLTSTRAFLDGPLARFYGLPAPAGTGPQLVSLPAKERSGLFTRAAFLAAKADADEDSPIRRG